MVVTTSVAANQLANEKTAISVNYKNNRYPFATETLHRITDRFYPAYRLDAGAISTDEERHDWKTWIKYTRKSWALVMVG